MDSKESFLNFTKPTTNKPMYQDFQISDATCDFFNSLFRFLFDKQFENFSISQLFLISKYKQYPRITLIIHDW